MGKKFFNVIKNFLLRYSIYFGILYLLYDNQLQLKSLFFNPYLQILLLILIACFIIKFIQTKTKFYFTIYFVKNFLAITVIFCYFFYRGKTLLPFLLFIKNSFVFIFLLDFICFVIIMFGLIKYDICKDIKYFIGLIDTDIRYLFVEFFSILSNIFKETFNHKTIQEIYRLFHNTDNFIENKNKSSFFETDEAIKNMNEENLGRKEFVEKLKTIFENKLEPKKSNVIGLFGKWGEGKTSCINLLKELLAEKNILEFIDINPWFNDTKEKMLNAIFGEINSFAKKNYPYKSLESEFNDILKLSTIKVPETPIEIDLNKFTSDKNVQNKVLEVGNILKKYSKRIVIVLDDLDRLNKDNILFILQIVQMFRENTNIVFILSCDDKKIKQILCEISEPYDKTNDDNKIIKTALYYEDYINKIVTIPIKLLKFGYFFITGELIKKLNNILQKQIVINNSDLLYIYTSSFETIRDVKRFYNYFIVAYELVDKRVDLYNFINISIFCVFYPELYDNAYHNQGQWFDCDYWKAITNHFSMDNREEERKKHINSFFEKIINQYNTEEQEKLKKILFLISPPYNIANKKEIPFKEVHIGETSYFRDIKFLSSYFIQYNSFINIISNLELWKEDKDINQRYKSINDLILYRMEFNQIENLFEYIENPLNYDINYSELYEQICFVFARNSLDIVDKQRTKLLDYVDVSNTIIRILNKNQQYDFTKIIEESSSAVLALFLMHRCYRSIENNFDQLFNNICLKIKRHIEIFLKCLYIQQNTMLFNICFQAWLFGKEHFEVYSQKKNSLDIKNLNKNEFTILKNKVSLAMSYFNKNIEHFKFLVIDPFLHNVEIHLEKESNKIKDRDIGGSIIFPIQVLGLRNIEVGIKETKDDKNIRLFNSLIKDKVFIEELSIETKLINKEIGYNKDFGEYEFIKDKSGFQEQYELEAEPMIINKKGENIKLLRSEYIPPSDINSFVDRDFLYQQNYLNEILWRKDTEKKLDTFGKKESNKFIICLICEEQDKQKLENNKKNIEERLNNNENIKKKNFIFKIEIETREKILSLYRE